MSYLMNAFKLLLLLFHLSVSVQSVSLVEECGFWTTAKLSFQCGSILSDVNETLINWKAYSIKAQVETCDKAIDCLAPYDCEQIRTGRNELIRACDQASYLDFDNTLCLQSFYRKAYMTKFENRTYGPSDSCFHEHSFMDENLDKRQEAYKNGKLCFNKYVRDYCTSETLEYFNAEHYNRFVEYISTDASSLPCKHPTGFLSLIQGKVIHYEYFGGIRQWVKSDNDEKRKNLGRLKEMCSDSKDSLTNWCIASNFSQKQEIYISCAMLDDFE